MEATYSLSFKRSKSECDSCLQNGSRVCLKSFTNLPHEAHSFEYCGIWSIRLQTLQLFVRRPDNCLIRIWYHWEIWSSECYLPTENIRSYQMHIHAYNWSSQPFSSNYYLVSHTYYAMFVYFMHKWWDLMVQVISEGQIIEETLSWQFLFAFRIFASYLLWEQIVDELFLSTSLYWRSLTWCLNRGLTANDLTHYLLSYVYFLFKWLITAFTNACLTTFTLFVGLVFKKLHCNLIEFS